MNNNKFEKSEEFRLRGVTLVEIFVALSVLAIVLTFAAAPLNRISAHIDVDIARHNILNALVTARRSAALANVPVRVMFPEQVPSDRSRYRLVAGHSRHRGAVELSALPDYALPAHITVSLLPGISEIEFLPGGEVGREVVISLSSRNDPDYVAEIRVGESLTPRAPGSPPGRRARH